uniref:Flagellar protein FliL n=1 Tax=Caenorhabditis tropicalis TaxID=1561998 RepID=A0A1I7UTC8_9PELO
MHRPCPFMVSAAVIGGAALLAVVYYYWSRPKKSLEVTVPIPVPTEERQGAGADASDVLFNIDDEHVREVCERLFMQEMDMGEDYMKDEQTAELGAIHIANAIALSGETTQLMKVLRGSIPPANYACIQKWLPSAEMRVNQLLQDELSVQLIEEHFG